MKLLKYFARYILLLCLLASPGLLLINTGTLAQEKMDKIAASTNNPLGSDNYLDARDSRNAFYFFGIMLALGIPAVGIYKLIRLIIFAYKTNGSSIDVITSPKDLGAFITDNQHHYLPVGLNPYCLKPINSLPPFKKDLHVEPYHLEPEGFRPRFLYVVPKRVKLKLRNRLEDYRDHYFPFLILSWDHNYRTPKEEEFLKMKESYDQGRIMAAALGARNSDGSYDADYVMEE